MRWTAGLISTSPLASSRVTSLQLGIIATPQTLDFETLAQPIPGPEQEDPKVIRGDGVALN
jgi:hypothetical protein